MTHTYSTGQETIACLSFLGLIALNTAQAYKARATHKRNTDLARVIKGTAQQQARLLNAHRTFERELQEELDRQQRLVFAMLVYARMYEHHSMTHTEEVQEIYERYDIITDSYQRIIDQRNETINELREALTAERRTINNLTNALFDLRAQVDKLKGEQ